MFSGEILFVEEEVQKKLFAFQSELRMFQVLMERAKISDQNAPDDETERLKDAFQKEIGYTDPELKPISLVNHAVDIKLMLNSEIRKYNSILDRLIIMFLIGAAVAAIKFFGK